MGGRVPKALEARFCLIAVDGGEDISAQEKCPSMARAQFAISRRARLTVTALLEASNNVSPLK
jgi:hypothetical protein